MNTHFKKALWRVYVTVKPAVEWEKIGIDSFDFSQQESIKLDKQVMGGTEFTLIVASKGDEAHFKAELLMKSFLACLELKAQRDYRFSIGSMEPIKPTAARNGWVLLAQQSFTIKVARKFEDLDLALFNEIRDSLKVLSISQRNRILGALEFLFDGLAAYTPQHTYLSLYGGLNYLVAGAVKAGKTTRREDLMAIQLAQKGILKIDEVEAWIRKFDEIDQTHYDVLYGRSLEKQDLDKIREFFEMFLVSYIKYLKAEPNNDLAKAE